MARYYPMHRRFGAVGPTPGYNYGPALGAGAQLPPDLYFEEDTIFDEELPVPARGPHPMVKPKRKGVSRKPGRAVKCKKVTYPNGTKRKLCWDKHGVLTSNTKPGARRKGKKVKCKTKCPKGTRKVCTGGYASRKGSKKKVCRKYTCKRKR